MNNEQPCINPIEDQRREALAHYQEVSRMACHWSSFVEAAIKAYNPASDFRQSIIDAYTAGQIDILKAVGEPLDVLKNDTEDGEEYYNQKFKQS